MADFKKKEGYKLSQTLSRKYDLYRQKYLTDREKIFLTEIIPYIAFSSNCIVLDIKAKNPVPANITEIAKLIDASRQPTSTVINSLVKKGILFKGDSGVERA